MNSRDYWEKRALARKLQAEKQAVHTAQEIQRQYDMASAAIQKDISYWLSKFADNNQISLSDAKKLLKADELKEFRWTVEEYIAHGMNNLDGRWEKELVNASSRVHISRLQALQTGLRQHVEQVTGKEQKALESLLGDTYKDQYLHRAFDIQKGIGVGWNLQQIDTVLKTPWASDGSLYSDRIWKQKSQMLYELNTQLTQAMITGKPLDQAAKAIADRFSVYKSRAATLVYTEAAAVASQAEKDCYKDLGVEEYEILATLDSKTSEICRSLDGKHFPVSEMQPGVTAPPFHPNCRTDTCPYFDDWEEFSGAPMRAARDENDQGYELVPANMTYKEWEKRFVREKTVENSAESGIIKTGCTIPDDKIYKFMLKDGAKHAQDFFSVGYTEKDGERLRNDIMSQFDAQKATEHRYNRDGTVDYSVFMDLGISKKRRFRTVWRDGEGQEVSRFITAHREEEK